MESPKIRKIIHIDMDAFYASVEQRDDPALQGKPVAVGSDRQRGVVVAASYEARQFGVRSAMASSMAIRKCPDLLFVKPRFDEYRAVSAQIRTVFAEYTDLIEPLSLDEAYLDVTNTPTLGGSATLIARVIKERIHQRTGLTASAGISYNKFLAKLASDYDKPDGLYVIRPQDGLDFVASLAVGQFHGIGRVTADRLNRLGIFTGLDLRQQEAAFLIRHFGKVGHHYYSIARAIDERPVQANRLRKSVGSEATFDVDLTDEPALVERLQPLLDDVWRYCDQTGIRGRRVTLKVKYADFQQLTRSRTVLHPIGDRGQLERLTRELLAGLMPLPKGVRLLGVSLGSLQASEHVGEQLRLSL